MMDKETAFLRSALNASDGKDGNFDFTCPHCGGYSIGARKSEFNLIMATCSVCGLHIHEKIIIKKGA